MCATKLHSELTASLNGIIVAWARSLLAMKELARSLITSWSSLPILKKRACAFLDRWRQHSVTLKQTKSQVRLLFLKLISVNFAGIQASPDLLKSPETITDLRSWFGLVNQLGNFSKELTTIMVPFRPLLSKNAVFQWLPERDHAFVEAKFRLSSAASFADILCCWSKNNSCHWRTSS